MQDKIVELKEYKKRIEKQKEEMFDIDEMANFYNDVRKFITECGHVDCIMSKSLVYNIIEMLGESLCAKIDYIDLNEKDLDIVNKIDGKGIIIENVDAKKLDVIRNNLADNVLFAEVDGMQLKTNNSRKL